MPYKVVKFFTDLHDNEHPYNVGDIFPRSGVSVTEARCAELAGRNNRQRVPLIQFVEEPKKKRAKKSEA
jgi:hypothetical protein